MRCPSALLSAGWRCRWYISTNAANLALLIILWAIYMAIGEDHGYVLQGNQLHGLPIGIRTWQETWWHLWCCISQHTPSWTRGVAGCAVSSERLIVCCD